MDGKDVSLTISQEIVKPIVEAKIKQALIEALGGSESALIGKMIDTFLLQKVNKDGKVEGSSYYDKYTYVDILLRNMVNEALKDAVKSWVDENREMIKAAVYEKLSTKATTKKMAGDIVAGLVKATENDWRFSTKFEFKSIED